MSWRTTHCCIRLDMKWLSHSMPSFVEYRYSHDLFIALQSVDVRLGNCCSQAYQLQSTCAYEHRVECGLDQDPCVTPEGEGGVEQLDIPNHSLYHSVEVGLLRGDPA